MLVVGAPFASVLGEDKGSVQHQGEVLWDDNEGFACALAGRKLCFFFIGRLSPVGAISPSCSLCASGVVLPSALGLAWAQGMLLTKM